MAQAPIRIVVHGLNEHYNGAFGTVRGTEGEEPILPIRSGVRYDIEWLEEHPIDMAFGSGATDAIGIDVDIMEGKYLTVIPEETFLAEAADIALDNG